MINRWLHRAKVYLSTLYTAVVKVIVVTIRFIKTLLLQYPWIRLLAAVIVLLFIAAPVVESITANRNMEACTADHAKCENQAIQLALRTPGDREHVAQTALAVYGPVIQALEESSSPMAPGLLPNLTSSYEILIEGLNSDRLDPGCVRDGLVELLIQDKLDNARTQVLTRSFKAVGQISGVGPTPTRALKSYFEFVGRIPQAATFLVGTYDHYVKFPHIQGSELFCARR